MKRLHSFLTIASIALGLATAQLLDASPIGRSAGIPARRLAITSLISRVPTSEQPAIEQAIEDFSFVIPNLKIDHQGEINNLNITIRYRYVAGVPHGAYPDFRSIAKDVEGFLSKYPNKTDYWEILNKKLTLILLKRYAALSRITSEMQISPSRLDPYSRSSIVTRNRKGSRNARISKAGARQRE